MELNKQFEKFFSELVGEEVRVVSATDKPAAFTIILDPMSTKLGRKISGKLRDPVKSGGYGFKSSAWKQAQLRLTLKKGENKRGMPKFIASLQSFKEEWSDEDVLLGMKVAIRSIADTGGRFLNITYDIKLKSLTFNLTTAGNKDQGKRKFFKGRLLGTFESFKISFQNLSDRNVNKHEVVGKVIYLNSDKQKNACIEYIKNGGIFPKEVIAIAPTEVSVILEKPTSSVKPSDLFGLWGIGELSEIEDSMFVLTIPDSLGYISYYFIQAVARHYGLVCDTTRVKSGSNEKIFYISNNGNISDKKFPLDLLYKNLREVLPEGLKLTEQKGKMSFTQSLLSGAGSNGHGFQVNNDLKIFKKDLYIKRVIKGGKELVIEYKGDDFKKLLSLIHSLGYVYKVDSDQKNISLKIDMTILSLMGFKDFGGHPLPESWSHKSISQTPAVEEADQISERVEEIIVEEVEIAGVATPTPQESTPSFSRKIVLQRPEVLGTAMQKVLEEQGYVFNPSKAGWVLDPARSGWVKDPGKNGWTRNEDIPEARILTYADAVTMVMQRLGIELGDGKKAYFTICDEKTAEDLTSASWFALKLIEFK